MRALVGLLALVLLSPTPTAAEAPVPDRHISISRDTDFPGNDLRPIFDTTLTACEAACRADPECRAFTFNSRSDACFPKSSVGDSVAFEGALSGILIDSEPRVLDGLDDRLAALPFLREADLSAARDQALSLGRTHYSGGFAAEAWRQAALAAEAEGNREGAVRFWGATVTLTDDPQDWIGYSRALLAHDGGTRSDTRQRETQALQAAINATLRARPGDDLALAAETLAAALERRGRGRDSIPALRLAIAEAPNPRRDAALDRAIGLFGFRVVDTRVESESDFPRICAVFSEDLAQGGVTYQDYLQTTDPDLSVEAEDRQICISGVRHGVRYEFTLRAGVPAASGEVLRHPVTLRQYVRDRAPSVRFGGRAYILPASANGALPVIAVNTDAVDLRLFRVSDRNILRTLQDDYFGRPLREWQIDRFADQIGEEVWEGSAEVATDPNRAVTTRLPMGEVLAGMTPGLYALEARAAEVPNAVPATQWFLVSDLGLSAMSAEDGLHVMVRGLGDAGPRPGLPVTLISAANRVLGEAVTDSDGYARFDAGLIRGTGGAEPALISVSEGEMDFAFLSLDEAEFDLSDRGVEGREPAGAIDLFLTTDRGAYRAGEVIRATALARDGQAQAITGLPLTAILTRADGVEYSRQLLTEAGAGGYVFDLPLGAEVPRGTWRLAVHADPDAAPLATASLLVEDFLPERLDLVLDLAEGPITPGDRPRLGLQADYLFGAPAGGLRAEGRVALRPLAELEAYPGYRFGRHDDPPAPEFASIAPVETDAMGAAEARLEVPALSGPPQPAQLTVTASITEGSGRPVERQITRPLLPEAPIIGIRPLFDGTLPEAAEAAFHLIAVNAETLPVRWTLNRVERRYQWYQQGGNWTWEPVTTRTRIATGDAVLGADPVTLSQPVEWGAFELRVESATGGFSLSSVGFTAGWYGADDGSGTPDVLEVSLDAESYRPGDTAMLRIVPRVGGTALIRVVSNRLIHQEVVTLGDEAATVPLPVTEDWGSGAYVTATLIRGLETETGPAPTRAIGLAHAAVDPGPHALDATLDAPEVTRPRGPMEVVLRVDGAQPGETVHATLAAVDLGILNLTGFDGPDPQGHYFGQRRLGVAFRDVYGRLIDSRDGAEGRIRSGGDAGAGLRMQAPPPTEDLLAEFSGPLTVGEDGTARVTVDLPAFNGTVRLMAVAWSETGVGQAERDVIVRDPVVVTASLPRFLSPGDQSRMLLEITHTEGEAGEMPLSIAATPGVRLGAFPSSITIGEGETVRLRVPVIAGDAAAVQDISVALTLPDGQLLQRDLALPVQVSDPVVAETWRVVLDPGTSMLIDGDMFNGMRPGTARSTVSAGPLARFDAAGLLTQLDRYPYGCTEQVTSQALPLIYLASVAEAVDLGSAADLAARIDDAIGRVLVNQAANGGFGLWSAGSGDLWLDAYVTDFLSRARAAGHEVPAIPFRSALDNLANRVAGHADFERGGEGLAYALMVMAREGTASMGDLRYYADVKAESFATPLALGQLGAALAMYGDQPRADAMFRAGYALLDRLQGEGEGQVWRSDYGSDRRDAAGLLALAADAGSQVIPAAALTETLETPQGGLSTQEAVWSLLAAHALIDSGTSGGLTRDGVPVTGPMVDVITDVNPTPRVLANDGDSDIALTFTTYGVRLGATEQAGNGFRIERSYLTLDGQPVDPSTVAQGTRMVAMLQVIPTGAREGRLMVNDPLPAGFEIDNPNLLQSGDVRAVQGLDLTTVPQHAEFRQDRFLAAVDLRGQARLTLAYVLRAVTPGSFHHPAASVEDMYRPAYRAQTASGRVVVTE